MSGRLPLESLLPIAVAVGPSGRKEVAVAQKLSVKLPPWGMREVRGGPPVLGVLGRKWALSKTHYTWLLMLAASSYFKYC